MADKNQLEDLITDLMYIRKDAGFTAQRMREASTLIEILGGGEQDYAALKARLISALDALPEQDDTDILRAAFALAPEYEKIQLLKDRRAIYGNKVGRGPDTVADRENAALRELALSLISMRYALSPMPGNAPAMHGTAIHERIEVVTLVRDRLWTETREVYRTISLIDGVEYFEISSDIPAKITPHSGIVAKTKTTSNGLQHRFYFAEPLKRGQAARLSFVMRPDGTKDDELVLKEETRAFHLPTLSSSMEVIFLGEKPSLIWHYAQLPLHERPGEPDKKRILNLNGGSAVRVEFGELYGGLYAGIAWRWR
jgi:hypothetical protein